MATSVIARFPQAILQRYQECAMPPEQPERRADQTGFRSAEEAAAWERGTANRASTLGAATARMLDLAHLGPGDRVLDLAAGTGEQTLLAARRVGPTGTVLATDIDANGLAIATETARAAGLTNITTRVLDAQALDLAPASFDAAISRLGLMFVRDVHQTLLGIAQILKPGSRIAVLVFSTPDRNLALAIPQAIGRHRAHPAQRGPEVARMFSLGTPGVLQTALVEAGFSDVAVEAVPTVQRFPSAAAYVRFLRESFVAMQRLQTGLSEREREAVWHEVEQDCRQFEGPAGFSAPGEVLIGSGTR
jgi:ubiquinone/menaquinone biosynthesis C-methylase UbiE